MFREGEIMGIKVTEQVRNWTKLKDRRKTAAAM
jgi:hypothetical protein